MQISCSGAVACKGCGTAGLTVATMLLQITGLPEQDVVFVRFDLDVINQPCLPYFIALDRDSSTIGEQLCAPVHESSLTGRFEQHICGQMTRVTFIILSCWLKQLASTLKTPKP